LNGEQDQKFYPTSLFIWCQPAIMSRWNYHIWPNISVFSTKHMAFILVL